MDDNPLIVLINREFSSIEFVMDYIQLRFEGSTLNVYSEPRIIVTGRTYDRKSPEFCNLVIGCISQIVAMAEVKEEDSIVIKFKNDAIFFISLKPEDYEGAEAALFDDMTHSGNWWVW